MTEKRNPNKRLDGKVEKKAILGKFKLRVEDNTEMDIDWKHGLKV
jgi:hypothetical protein